MGTLQVRDTLEAVSFHASSPTLVSSANFPLPVRSIVEIGFNVSGILSHACGTRAPG
jgi:hypothetical protein